jgi:predicted GNAT family N-acyltransferase
MITSFRICCIKNGLISSDKHDKIIMLKDQYWHYPKESHEKWRQENLNDDDYHLWLENDSGVIFAYLNLVFLKIRIEKRNEEALGVGNVCVSKDFSGKGVGLLLMQICNYYISYHEKRALLLCKRSLSGFYRKSGWVEYQGTVILKGQEYSELLMFNKVVAESYIEIERNF